MTNFFKIGHKLFWKKWGKKHQMSVVVWDLACLTDIYNNTGQQAFCPEAKPLVSIQFWVAESESGIRFFPSRQNFAVLPISWLPGLKISFSSFSEKLREISKIWPDIGDSKLNSAHFKKKKLKIGSAVLEILAI